MADEEDVRLLKSGERDLSRCDFRGADISGLDLSGRDFSHSLFQKTNASNTNFTDCTFSRASLSFIKAPGAIFDNSDLTRAHFGYCDLRGASFSNVKATNAHLQNSDFSEVNFSGADFSGADINPDNKFREARFDGNTRFDGARVIRTVARDPLFKAYRFEKGFLKRITSDGQRIEDTDSTLLGVSSFAPLEPSPTSIAVERTQIAVRISQNAADVASLAQSISQAASEEISALETQRPNDPEHLDFYEKYIALLQRISDQLDALSKATKIPLPQVAPDISDYLEPADIVTDVHGSIRNWWSENGPSTVAYGFKVGLLGIGSAFLSLCGAPALPAFIVATALLGGKELAEHLKTQTK